MSGRSGGRSGRRGNWRAGRLRAISVWAVLGVTAGVGMQTWTGAPGEAVVTGLLVALLGIAGTALWEIFSVDAEEMRDHFADVDPGRGEVELLSLTGALGAVAGMMALMFGAPGDPVLAGLGLATVLAGWLTLHTTFAFAYAKHAVLVEPGCIDFDRSKDRGGAAGPQEDDGGSGVQEPPPLADLAYTAFSVGMTYQISDTTLRSSAMRRIDFRHSLLSYLFGTVVIASSINLVASLALQ